MPAPDANGARPFLSGKRARKLVARATHRAFPQGHASQGQNSLEKGPTIAMRKNERDDYRSISAPNGRFLEGYLDIWRLRPIYVIWLQK